MFVWPARVMSTIGDSPAAAPLVRLALNGALPTLNHPRVLLVKGHTEWPSREGANMRPAKALLTLSLVGVIFGPPSARAYDVPARLTEVAHVYSLGVGEIRCPSETEWSADFASSFSSAYTNLRDDYTVLGPRVCAGALNVGTATVPGWQQALGVLVLTHEAFHLRHWRFRRDEGKVECQALVYFRDAAQRLGATASQAEDLYPYALALHSYKVRLFPQYRDPACLVPPWSPPPDS
jgi:hypothetical protein